MVAICIPSLQNKVKRATIIALRAIMVVIPFIFFIYVFFLKKDAQATAKGIRLLFFKKRRQQKGYFSLFFLKQSCVSSLKKKTESRDFFKTTFLPDFI